MKKITLLFLLLAVSLGYSQVIVEDFEGAAPTTNLFDGFGSATVTADPVTPSENSLELITSASGNAWQGAELILQNESLDLSTTNKVVTVRVYSIPATDILAKVTAGGTDSATDASHPGMGWATLSFDFSMARDGTGVADGIYSNIIFYPLWNNVGGTCTAGCYSPYGTPNQSAMETIYVDDIAGLVPAAATCTDGIQNGDETGVDCGGTNCAPCPPPPSPECIVNFETNLPTIEPQNGLDAGPGGATVVADPGNGDNNSVLEVVSSAAGQPWQAANLLLQGNTIDLTTDKTVTVEIYSLNAINILGKVVSGGPDSATDSAHTGMGWESLVFDFSAPDDGTAVANGQYSQIAFFPSWAGDNSGNNATNSDFNDAVDGTTFYVNCITAVPGTPTPAPVNDDCVDATSITLGTSIAFDNIGGTDSSVASCFTGSVRDIWYSFTAPASGEVTIVVGAGTQYALFSDCNTEVSCNTDVNLVTTGNIYYVSVSDDGTNKVPGASTVQVNETMTLSTPDFATTSLFSYYPNPVNNTLTLNAQNEITNVVVFNMLGQSIIRTSPNAVSKDVDMSNLQSGAYFVQVTVGNELETIRVIKN